MLTKAIHILAFMSATAAFRVGRPLTSVRTPVVMMSTMSPPQLQVAKNERALFEAASYPVATSPALNTVQLAKPLGMVVQETFPGAPGAKVQVIKPGLGAALAGVRVNDLLVAINGEDVTQTPFTQIVDMLVQSGETVEATFVPVATSPSPTTSSSTPSPVPARRSAALPWLATPPTLALDASHGETSRPGGVLGASLEGNAGFDPLGFATDRHKLFELREAEIKHSRLAMLAAVGWPAAELLDRPAADLVGVPSVLDLNQGLNPTLLNGGLLTLVSPWWWLGVVAFTAWVESVGSGRRVAATVTNTPWRPGDLGFDPLNLLLAGSGSSNAGGDSAAQQQQQQQRRRHLEASEIKNGRVAMLAVTGFAVQEAVFRTSVVEQTLAFVQQLGLSAS